MHCRGVTGNEGKLRLREFKMILANSLMRLANQHQQRGEGHLWLMLRSKKKMWSSSSSSTKAIRLDGLDHWPVFMESGKKGRCKNPGCEATTRI